MIPAPRFSFTVYLSRIRPAKWDRGRGAVVLNSYTSLAVREALLGCPSSFHYPTRSLNEVKPQVHSNNSVARVCAM